jgi:glycosyltransferase involved in cell wall biosynthesis
MYSQMAAGKPTIVVSDDWSEVAQVVKEEDVGWVVEPDDVDGLVKVIQYAADHPETCAAMGARAAAVACSKYSFEKAIQSYKAVFAEELAKGRPVEVQVSSR